jgi:hypothetical protein
MEVDFCIAALEEAMDLFGRPAIFNSDQGSQSTSPRFTEVLIATVFAFPWTVAVAGRIMCSLSACGAASNMNAPPSRVRDRIGVAGRPGMVDWLQ